MLFSPGATIVQYAQGPDGQLLIPAGSAYQLSTIGGQSVVMATSGSAASEEASRKRELRLLKNRWVVHIMYSNLGIYLDSNVTVSLYNNLAVKYGHIMIRTDQSIDNIIYFAPIQYLLGTFMALGFAEMRVLG